MNSLVPFHFLLLAAGHVLRCHDTVTPQKIQNFILEDETFGVRVPLAECRQALQLLEQSYFLEEVSPGEYVWKLEQD